MHTVISRSQRKWEWKRYSWNVKNIDYHGSTRKRDSLVIPDKLDIGGDIRFLSHWVQTHFLWYQLCATSGQFSLLRRENSWGITKIKYNYTEKILCWKQRLACQLAHTCKTSTFPCENNSPRRKYANRYGFSVNLGKIAQNG